jgi:hypothetical protein
MIDDRYSTIVTSVAMAFIGLAAAPRSSTESCSWCAAGAQPGNPVYLEGCQAAESFPKEFKHWKKMLPALAVKSSAATFDGKAVVTKQGPLTVDKSVPDGAAIS